MAERLRIKVPFLKRHIPSFPLLMMLAIIAVVALVSVSRSPSGPTGALADHATQACSVGIGIDIQAVFEGTNDQAGAALVGDTVEYIVSVNLTAAQCPVREFPAGAGNGGVVELHLPNGSIVELEDNLDLLSGASVTYDRVPYTLAAGDKPVANAVGHVLGARSHRFQLSPQTTNANGPWDIDVLEQLEVSKTVDPAFDRTITWEIDKDVDPGELFIPEGGSDTADYTVDLTKTVADGNYSVSGEITIFNPNTTFPVTVNTVTDSVNGTTATVVCPGGLSQDLAPLATLTCTYDAIELDGDEENNEVEVGATYFSLEVGNSATEPIDWDEAEITIIGFEEVDVEDNFNNGDIVELIGEGIGDTTSIPYTRTFVCGDGEGEFQGENNLVPNTATIVETGDSDDAEVIVHCVPPLDVTKDAVPAIHRVITWEIDKDVDPATHNLGEGGSGDSDYEVTVTKIVSESFSVSGTITVENVSTVANAIVTSVSDLITPGAIVAAVDCSGDLDFTAFPHTLEPGDTLTCTYSADLPDGDDRTNTATANVHADSVVAGGSGTADIDFSSVVPTVEGFETVNVTDTNQEDPLGSTDETTTFPYTVTFTCGDGEGEFGPGTHQIPNRAEIVETGQTDNTNVTVSCPTPAGAVLLIIDEDSLDNGIHFNASGGPIVPGGPNFFSKLDVNDDKPSKTQRDVLRYFEQNVGATIRVRTGQTGDEGWFAPGCIPLKWVANSGSSNTCQTPSSDPASAFQRAIDNYFWMGRNNNAGQSTIAISQSRLDKIPQVRPLRSLGLHALIGRDVCAVVYDSDISINYDHGKPLEVNGNLQGETLGIVAFRVVSTHQNDLFSSSTLPDVTITILDTSVCGNWQIFQAPVPRSSSVPNDRLVPPSVSGYVGNVAPTLAEYQAIVNSFFLP